MIRSQTGTILWKHGRRLKGSRLLADPFSRPNLIVLDTLGKLNAHGHGVDGLLPRVPASVQRVDHRSDPRARRLQPGRRHEAAALPGLRRSHDRGAVEGWLARKQKPRR